jgi:hypothetical protein
MTRVAILAVPSLLFLPAPTALGASQCDQAAIAVMSRLRLAERSRNSIGHVANDENCRTYFKQFVEAVAARQTAATCQEGMGRQRALEMFDAKIQTFNDRIAEQSCQQ